MDLQWTDLRHTFATRLEMVGVNATTIADLLGHINLGLVQRHMQVSSLSAKLRSGPRLTDADCWTPVRHEGVAVRLEGTEVELGR